LRGSDDCELRNGLSTDINTKQNRNFVSICKKKHLKLPKIIMHHLPFPTAALNSHWNCFAKRLKNRTAAAAAAAVQFGGGADAAAAAATAADADDAH
jgi:hypothetical protein